MRFFIAQNVGQSNAERNVTMTEHFDDKMRGAKAWQKIFGSSF